MKTNMKTFIIQNKVYIALLIVALVALGFVLSIVAAPAEQEGDEKQATAQPVEVIRLSEQSGGQEIKLTGVVESQAQAVLSAERSGVVQQIYADIGAWVNQGQVIVRLDTQEAAADLAQAEAGLAAAQSQALSSEVQTGNTELSLLNAIESAQATVDDVKEAKVGQFFSDEEDLTGFGIVISQGNKTYYIDASDFESVQSISSGARETRESMEQLKQTIESDESIEVKAAAAEDALTAMRDLLNAIAQEVNKYTADSTEEQAVFGPFQNDISSARSSVTASLTTLRNAIQSYNTSQVSDAQSQIDRAEAQVLAARARLAKGVIRAPFSGEVTTMDARVGESVSPSQQLLSIVNDNALRVAISVSPSEAKRLSVGLPVIIDGNYQGVVSAVSSGINPQTGKVEAHVSVSDPSAHLIVGEFVDATVQAGNAAGTQSVPLRAVRTTGSGSFVFTIEDGIARRIPVETGQVGDISVTIESGLAGVEEIIADVSSVREGQSVTAAVQGS